MAALEPAVETYNPNAIPNGGDIILINETQNEYIAEVLTPTDSADLVDLPNELGQTRRRPGFLIGKRETGTYEIQIGAGDPRPAIGQTFNKDLYDDGTTLKCVIRTRTPARQMGTYRKQSGEYYVEGVAA